MHLECDLTSSLADWVIDYPAVLPVFEELQLDYCCGGRSLEFECQRKGLDPRGVLARLQQLLQDADGQAVDHEDQ